MFRLTASAVKPNHRRQLAISGPWIAIISGLLAIATYREGTAAGPSQDQQQIKVVSTDRAKDTPGQKKVDPERQLLADLDLAINAYFDHADYSRFDRELAAAFRAYGLDLDVVDPKTAGGKLAGRPSTPEIAAAIDEGCRIRRTRIKVPTWHRLVEVARAADPDTWRNAVRDQFDRPPADALPELRARAADAKTLEKQPVNSLLVLSTMLSEADDRPTAAVVLRVANKRFPDNFSVCLLRGSLAIYGAPNPDAAEAARLCATAVTQRPKSPFARINRALAFQMENKPDEAAHEFREAIRLKPDFVRAHTELAAALSEQGKHDQAIAEFREVVKLEPADSQTHFSLGYELEQNGKLDEAMACYREAIRLQPDNTQAHLYLAPVLSKQGKHDKAIAEFREAIRRAPGDA